MKNIFYTLLGVGFAFAANAQLVNNGATIIVENGATLYIESDLTNNTVGGTPGVIDVQGTGVIEVQGNVLNAGTLTMSDNSKIIFSGSDAATVTSGGATISNVEMDKTAQTITLMDAMAVNGDINFVGDNNKIVLGANNLTLGTAATITSADDNEYIVADAAGVVTKDLSAASMFKYEIGSATAYTPLDADVTAGTFPMALSVNTVSMKQGDVPAEATDFINRHWNVDAADATDLAATLTGTYATADIEAGSDATAIKGAHFGTEWTYADAAGSANTVVGSIAENGDFTGTNSFGRVGLTAMLDGAFSGGTMNTTLNSAGLLPTTSPYGGGEMVASDFFTSNTDIVDWIEFETRNTTTPATVEGTGVGFVKTDGSIVALDGVSNPFIKDAETTGYVVIKHRNHLAICTGTSISLDGSVDIDFTDAAYTAFGTDGLKNNGGTMTMWAGDSNNNGTLSYNGGSNDRDAILFALLFDATGSLTDVYNNADVNMNGTVSYNGGSNDRDAILFSLLFDATSSKTAQIPE